MKVQMSTNNGTGSFTSLRSNRGRRSSVFQFWRGLGYEDCVSRIWWGM